MNITQLNITQRVFGSCSPGRNNTKKNTDKVNK